MGVPRNLYRVHIPALLADYDGERNDSVHGHGIKYRRRPFGKLPKDKIELFYKALYESNGAANNGVCFNMALAGAPYGSIVETANNMREKGMLENNAYVLARNDREHRKTRGKRHYSVPIEETCIARALAKVFSVSLDDIYWHATGDHLPGIEDGSVFADCLLDLDSIQQFKVNQNWSKAYNPEYTTAYLPVRTALGSVCCLMKMDEVRRSVIAADTDIAQKLLIRRGYNNNVPGELYKTYTTVEWRKRQIEDYFYELYQLASREEGQLDELTEDDLAAHIWYRTLSEIGYYNNLLSTPKDLANYEVAQMVLDAVGLGVVTYKTTDKKRKRGYRRLLVFIKKLGKEYDKMIKQGIKPEVVRDTLKTILQDWCNDVKNTDGTWKVFTRKDWTPVVPEEKIKKKTSRASAPKATLADIEKVLGEK